MPEVPRNALARSNITACARCRRRKQRCDLKLPKCKSCERAGVECVSLDAVTQRSIPRSYVHSLEERVAFLENKLLENGINNYEPAGGGQNGAGVTPLLMDTGGLQFQRHRDVVDSHQQAGKIVESITANLGLESRPEHSFTTSLLRQLYRAEAMRDGLPAVSATQDDSSRGLSLPPPLDHLSPIDFPSPALAEHLVRVFFELSNFSNPILHEVTFREHLALASNSDANADTTQGGAPKNPMSSFFAFIVFAIALLTLQKHDSTNVSTALCERYFASALHSLDPVGLPDDLEGVQALLLISFYSYLHARAFDPWRTVGMALRLAVGLGLHRDLPADRTDPLTLDTRRRVFWVAYSMDRTVGTLLGRPFSISDGAIDCQLPSATDDQFITREGIQDGPVGPKAFGLHYLRYRQLQSEIQVTLYEKLPLHLTAAFDFGAWQRDMHDRLSQWLSTQPGGNNNGASNIAPPEALQLAYHQALILLYRPSPAVPPPPAPASLLALADSASLIIQLYRRLHRENKLRLFWQAVHNLFAAGTALLHCYAHSPEMRRRVSLRSLEASVHACSAVLWAMAERFPAARGRRDAFDVIALAALDSLTADAAAAAADDSAAATSPTLCDATSLRDGSQSGGKAIRGGAKVGSNNHAPYDGSQVTPASSDVLASPGLQPAFGGPDQLMMGFISPWPGCLDEPLIEAAHGSSGVGGLDESALDPGLFESRIGLTSWI